MTHHRRRASARLLPFALLSLVILNGCGQSAATVAPPAATAPQPNGSVPGSDDRENAAGPPRSGGELTVGLAAETNSFNPYIGQWAASSYTVANAIFEPLAAVDAAGIAHPYLAEKIETTGDFKEWTIRLRPGIVFHNGEKLDAAAVKLNLDTGRKSGLTSTVFTVVESVEAADDLTVKVKMSKPWATFPATLALQSGYMAAPAMIADPAGANADPIGTGPFEFSSRVRDASLVTKKNPKYWRKDDTGATLPYLDAVTFKVLADATSRADALRSGDVNTIEVNTPGEFNAELEAARRGDVQIVTSIKQETDENIVALNTTKEPFNDPIARQALALGIDQDKLSTTAYQGAYPAAWGMFEEGSPYYISKQEAGYPEHNIEKARELVKQYEQTHGKPLSFTSLIPPDPAYLAISQVFQAEAKEFGIDIQIQAMEQSTMVTRVVTGDYQAAGFVMWSSPTPDQAYTMIATKAPATGISLNFSRFDDPEITAAMDEFRSAGDAPSRIEAIKKVQKRLVVDNQMLFLVHTRLAFVYGNNVHRVKGSTTFPGTNVPVFGRYPTTPFYGSIWKG